MNYTPTNFFANVNYLTLFGGYPDPSTKRGRTAVRVEAMVAAEPEAFAVALWAAFSGETEFSLRQWIVVDRPVIASFIAHGWLFQVFGQRKPVKEQNGWRHFIAERRLLRLGGPTFRAAIMRERSRGMKTEPAFATVLRLKGDPYLAIRDLECCDNGRLSHLLVRAGFGGHLPSTGHYPP